MCTSTIWSVRARARSRVHLLGNLNHSTLHSSSSPIFLQAIRKPLRRPFIFFIFPPTHIRPGLGYDSTLLSSPHSLLCPRCKDRNGANLTSSCPLLTPKPQRHCSAGVFIPMRVHHLPHAHTHTRLHESDHARRSGHRPITLIISNSLNQHLRNGVIIESSSFSSLWCGVLS